MNYRLCLSAAAIALALLQDAAGQVLFHDDLENGTGNWSTYPGNPVCTPLSYVTTATISHANHTPGGAAGFQMTRSSDRVMHDLSPAAYGQFGLHLSLWYYDALNFSGTDFEAFDLRTQNSSQILGFATRGVSYSHSPFYWCRVLDVTGYDPTGGGGYRVTPIQRTSGWHHLEIFQFRDRAHLNTAEFYIDGLLALRQTDVVDTTLTRVVLGRIGLVREFLANRLCGRHHGVNRA